MPKFIPFTDQPDVFFEMDEQRGLAIEVRGERWHFGSTGTLIGPTSAAVGGLTGWETDVDGNLVCAGGGQLRAGDGSAALPAVSVGEVDTGIYFDTNVNEWGSDHMLGVAVDGTRMAAFDNDWGTLRLFAGLQLQGNHGISITDANDTVNRLSLSVNEGTTGNYNAILSVRAGGSGKVILSSEENDGSVRLGRLGGKIALLGGTQSAAQGVSGAATDPAETMALVNELRAALVQFGLLV